MQRIIRTIAAATIAAAVTAMSAGDVLAQAAKTSSPAKPAAAAPAAAPAPELPPLKQIPLTEKQIDSVLAAQKDIDAVTATLPENATGPDAKVMAQLDAVAKKHGFADYADYNVVVENISLVLSGFDPKTKTYVGSEAVIKQQLAAVQADKKMPAADKKQALADLNGALKSPPPAIETRANIDLVGKYYDRLFAAMQDE
jgi:hypothetical protein